MPKYALLHVGFAPPGPQDMDRWREWFVSLAPYQADNIGLNPIAKLSDGQETPLELDLEAITGLSIVDTLDEATALALARACPSVTACIVSAVREH